MTGPKTNERPGTRAVLRHYRMSPTKARQVLDLVRGHDVDRAEEILRTTPREAARVVSKVLASAVANAQHNDQLDPEELYVSACFADEGTTLKRWRPRARGRATRIRKRTCHITVIVSRLPEERLARRRSRADTAGAQRFRRVAASRRGDEGDETTAPAAAGMSAGDAFSSPVGAGTSVADSATEGPPTAEAGTGEASGEGAVTSAGDTAAGDAGDAAAGGGAGAWAPAGGGEDEAVEDEASGDAGEED